MMLQSGSPVGVWWSAGPCSRLIASPSATQSVVAADNRGPIPAAGKCLSGCSPTQVPSFATTHCQTITVTAGGETPGLGCLPQRQTAWRSGTRSGETRSSAPPHANRDPDCASSCSRTDHIRTQPLSQLAARRFQEILQRGIVDHTGLTGTYSGSVTYTPDNAPRIARRIFLAATRTARRSSQRSQEQLGLKLGRAAARWTCS